MKKRLITAILCLTIGTSAFALPKGEKSGADLSSIIQLEATKDNVIKQLGEPDKILAVKGVTYWSYNKDGMEIRLQWDELSSSITHMTYESRKNRSETWSSAQQSMLKIDTSTFTEILNIMGMPDGLIVNTSEQQSVRYKYANYTLSMMFDNGVLARYELNKT